MVVSESSDSSNSNGDNEEPQQWHQQLQLPTWLVEHTMVQAFGIPVGALIVSFILTGHGSFIWSYLVIPTWKLLLTIVGTTLGVGLGLGLALHVHEYLTAMHERNLQQEANAANNNSRSLPSPLKKSATSGLSSSHSNSYNALMEEETAYASLMTTAGYDVSDHVLRGQVVKGQSTFFERFYPFTDRTGDTTPDTQTPQDPASKWRSVLMMQEQWPTLPASISFELGRFMEYVVRDFIASWYYYIDPGVVYVDERAKRKREQEESKESTSLETNNATDRQETTPILPLERPTKKMIFSTARHRPVPMMSAMYQSLGIIFGNLSTRVEGANLFSLLLIKWTKVLSQSFRVYRKLRKEAYKKEHPRQHASLKKQRSKSLRSSVGGIQAMPVSEHASPEAMGDVSEMAVTREFLKRGKLHRAVTFGMDVPSLLFGDAKGEDCGVGATATHSSDTPMTPDQVLEKRLFDAKIMYECEMDYNRVLGHRLVRALLPRAEFSSPIIRTMMTEMMAGCILTPLMSCFCPEYLNGWIVMGCAAPPADGEEGSDDSKKHDATGGVKEKNNVEEDEDDGLMRGWGQQGSAVTPAAATTSTVDDTKKSTPRETRHQSVVEPGVEISESSSILAMQPSNDSTDPAVGVEMTMSQSTEFFKPKDAGVILDDQDEGIDNLDEHRRSELLDSMDEEAGSIQGSEVVDNNGSLHDLDRKETVVEEVEQKPLPTGDFVLPLLSMSMIDLQRFMDFQECRDARAQQQESDVKWEDPDMQLSISQLVLVIEAALLHGRRKDKFEEGIAERKEVGDEDDDDIDDSDKAIEVSITTATFSKVLMEITNDPDEFEDKIMQEEEEYMDRESRLTEDSQGAVEVWEANPSDLSTLRSLIAAWLHTGQAHRVMSVLINAKHSIIKPFFYKHSFIRSRENGEGFVRQLRQLNGVHILVDTLAVLSNPNMDVNEDGKTAIPKPEERTRTPESIVSTATSGLRSSLAAEQGESTRKKSARFSFRGVEAQAESEQSVAPSSAAAPMTLPQAYVSSTGLPRFLDFRRNENFASSLRSDRERRMQSWSNAAKNDLKGLQVVCRLKGSTDAGVAAHREMHQVARIFYSGTNLIALRNGARRKGADDADSQASGASEDLVPLSLLTVEMACQRRRLEVPDDDSSFLLRAQPRPLNAIGVHRDQRNHDMSFKCFAATYDEPAYRPGQTKYTGGRYVRKCMLRYFPNDRTAQIVVPNETRHLDQRKDKGAVPSSINVGNSSAVPHLPAEFLRERHLCQKWTPKGATPRSGSILASSVMETGDFNAVPRSGKAIDFVYRMSLFERPMVELSGKRFMVHDSAAMGPHRADASSLEMSDAAISLALLSIGSDWGDQKDDISLLDDHEEVEKQRRNVRRSSIEMGSDGYPIVWMKYTRKQGENNITEVKSYRTSYIRAALMVTSARQDAQSQCLVKCVRAGSARSATKQRTEAYLQPTSKLLEYANSPEREKQSVLLRDLKLGMNNIDQAQLRRNGLLSPRYPTEIRGLIASCEGAAQVKDQHALSMPGMVPTITMYKIRCKALIALANTDLSEEEVAPFEAPDGRATKLFCEEWVIYRPMKDIQILHKHLKTQVAPSEQSASAGARLVGAATAAFAATTTQANQRARKKIMIPSLNQAQKVGALGVTKKVIQKRCEVLNGYFQHLLAADHPLNRCSEMLMFLGAFYPFPPDVNTEGDPVTNTTDPLGRMEMRRVVFEVAEPVAPDKAISAGGQSVGAAPTRSLADDGTVLTIQTAGSAEFSTAASESVRSTTNLEGSSTRRRSEVTEGASAAQGEEKKTRVKEIDMIPSIKAKIDEVPLAQVRSALFDVVRYQFDFDNASFFRNRMFSALKTMSFAVATPGEFRKMLYEAHLEHLNAESLAGWIKFLTETIFPEGVFMEFSDPTSEEDLKKLSQQAKDVLPQAFPDQLRAVLGTEIVQGGLDMLHEMLQNRAVLRSMSYMLFDLLWLEIFPELHDILTGPAALESE